MKCSRGMFRRSRWWCAAAGVFVLSDREGGGGRECCGCPLSLETSDRMGGGCDVRGWQENPPTRFERGRWWWWLRIPSITRIASGGVVVGRETLRLVLRASEGLWWVGRLVVMGTNPLRHSNREWEAVSWQENPPTRVSSEGGVGGGRESPPSLESRVGGQENPPTRVSSEGGVVVDGQVGGGGHKSPPSLESRVGGRWCLAGNPTNSRYEQGRGWACAGCV